MQYSGQPPVKFDGPVTRIDVDPKANEAKLPRMATPDKPADEGVKAPRDINTERRDNRLKLEAARTAAREKLRVAREALDNAAGPQDEERQVVQQRVQKGASAPGPGSASTGGMLGNGGMHGGAQRVNCKTVKGADGKTVTTCPTLVPSDQYYDRVKKLEDAVKAAEEELEAAELAYRRGVD